MVAQSLITTIGGGGLNLTTVSHFGAQGGPNNVQNDVQNDVQNNLKRCQTRRAPYTIFSRALLRRILSYRDSDTPLPRGSADLLNSVSVHVMPVFGIIWPPRALHWVHLSYALLAVSPSAQFVEIGARLWPSFEKGGGPDSSVFQEISSNWQ